MGGGHSREVIQSTQEAVAGTSSPSPPSGKPPTDPSKGARKGDKVSGQQPPAASEPGGGDSSDEEKESFRGWLTSTSDKERSSIESLPSTVRASCMSSNPSDSHEATSSSAWLGNRPSADTPLPMTSGPLPSAAQESKRTTLDLPSPAPNPTVQLRGSLASRSSASSAGPGGPLSADSFSPAASARSSFALERASLEANFRSFEAFQGAFNDVHSSSGPALGLGIEGQRSGSLGMMQQEFANLESVGEKGTVSLEVLMKMSGVPIEVADQYAALCVLPPQTPAPISMLMNLWALDERNTKAKLSIFASHGVVKMAKLPSGDLWALPQAQQLQLLQISCKDSAQEHHARLLDGYIKRGGLNRALADLVDDGYIVANVGYHLVGAGRVDTLRQLLFDLGWLERKIGTCGPASVVADFRRYLMLKTDKEVKLVLEAFQMSVSVVSAHPQVPGLLRCVMSSRLMAAPLSSSMQSWLATQREVVKQACVKLAKSGIPRPLLPHTPSLDQAGGLQRLAFKGHKGPVTHILLTPSGTDAISASTDGTARVWDLEIGDCILVLDGHTGPITDMGITDDGSLLITASEDGTARAYEMEQGQCLRVLAGHSGPINALVVDPQGRFIATTGPDETARVWDLVSARTLHNFPAPNGGCSLALSQCTRFLMVGCMDGTARMYDIVSGQSVGVMEGHSSWVSAVKLLPGGKRALTASHDGSLRLWSLRTGQCLGIMEGHVGRINAVVVAADGKVAATAGDDGTTRVWDLRVPVTCIRVLKAHRAWVSNLALSPSCLVKPSSSHHQRGSTLHEDRLVTTSGDGTAIAWNLDTGEVVRILEGHSASILAAAVTRKGRFAVTGSEDGTVRVWDFCASSSHTPRWHEGRIRAITGRDGKVVATAGDDCEARVWDASAGEYRGLLIGHKVPIRWVQFSQDASHLVTASPDRMVCLWDADSSELVRTLPLHKGSRMKSFAANGDLSLAVVCLFDSTVTVWDLKSCQPKATLQRWGDRNEATGHTSAVNQVCMNKDGDIVVTLSKDSTARIWDVQSGKCRAVLRGHEDSIAGGCLSPDDGVLATYGYDGTVRLWYVSLEDSSVMQRGLMQRGNEKVDHTVSPFAVLKLPPQSRVSKLACVSLYRDRNDDGYDPQMGRLNCLAVALMDGRVLVYHVAHEKGSKGSVHCTTHKVCLADDSRRMDGEEMDTTDSDVTDLCFSADGHRLVVCSSDGILRVIQTSLENPTAPLEGIFVSDCGLTCCFYDSLTECIVAGTDRGVVHFIDASCPDV